MIPPYNLRHVTIVILEDHPDTQTFLSDFLTRQGARVIAASDATKGLARKTHK